MILSKLTVVILAKNEEANIPKCIRSVPFANNILVIDDFSTDKTAKVGKSEKVTVIQKKLEGDFAAQRNFAVSKVKTDWILFLDADEEVDIDLAKNILSILAVNGEKNGYYICRRDFWQGRELKYGETVTARKKGLLRLMKKGSGKWSGRVHERYGLHGTAGILKGYINHYPHVNIKDFLQKINAYSTLRAQELLFQEVKPSLFRLIMFPFVKFIYTYVICLGFLDGGAGFIYSFMMSFHSFLVRAKLYQYYVIDRT